MTGPVILERKGLTVTVIPDHGARIAQITDRLGRRWLSDTGRGELPEFAAVEFANGTRGGWDECLPSVSACADPNRPGVQIADHGDFWTTPWTVQARSDDHLSLISGVPVHPLEVRKTLRLTADRAALQIELELYNRSRHPYHYLYSAHPLWSFDNDVFLELPGAGETVTAFGPGWSETISGRWPMLNLPDNPAQDLSHITHGGECTNYKFFVRWSGRAHYCVPALGATLLVRQSTENTPWLGVCVNRGAYPDCAAGEHWIALEPTTAPTDSLATALAGRQARTLGPSASVRMVADIEIRTEGRA